MLQRKSFNLIIVLIVVVFITSFYSCNNSNTSKSRPWHTVKDIDGNIYCTVQIGLQSWTLENFKGTHYNNGDLIPNVEDPTQWSTLTTGARCYYNNDSARYMPGYGALYNWYVVHDPRGIAPKGWHVADSADFIILIKALGGNPIDGHDTIVGGHLKVEDTIYWVFPNTGADNSSGFSALPAGFRFFNGVFDVYGYLAHFWTSSESTVKHNNIYFQDGNVYFIGLNYNSTRVDIATFSKRIGMSIRFVKD